uniref:GCR013 n=1 Tax=Schmidtea mediterranea TaxID=79327 RepID=A0A193KUK5_SCHMD|nr:GCR013 [Schmidtea mediterranea]
MHSTISRNISLSIDIGYSKNVVIILASTCTSIGTVFGNGLIITAFIMEKKIRIPSNYFIASLAITDILIGLFSMNLFSIYVVLGYWPLGYILCNIWLSFDYTVCLTSQYTVLLITVDRYCSVKIPAKYRIWRTEKKVYLLIVLAWIIPACLFITIIIIWNCRSQSPSVDSQQCFAEFTLYPIFNTVFTIAYFWITLIIMCVLYIGIYRVARRLHQNSDTKRKRLTSLMATAGQTMSKIGVGLSLANLDVNVQFKNFLKDNPFNETTTERNLLNDNCLYPDSSRNNYSISSRVSPSEETNSLMINNIFPKSHSETLFTDSLRFSPKSNKDKCLNLFEDIQYIDEDSSGDSKTNYEFNISNFYTNRYNLPSINISQSEVHGKFHLENNREIKYKSWDNTVSKSALKAMRFLKSVHNMSKRIDIRNHSKAKKSLKTISFILGAFIICWTPYHVLILIKGFCDNPPKSCINDVLYNASYWLCYINSPINPFCYALSNSQFKKTLLKLIKGDFSRS